MLVLSRKIRQTVCVNNNIKITVIEICGDRVRLGIEAPREVSIHRQEIAEAIAVKKIKEESNLEASGDQPGVSSC